MINYQDHSDTAYLVPVQIWHQVKPVGAFTVNCTLTTEAAVIVIDLVVDSADARACDIVVL